jgi:hypothetical protein
VLWNIQQTAESSKPVQFWGEKAGGYYVTFAQPILVGI